MAVDSRHEFAFLSLTSMNQNTSVTRLRVPIRTLRLWIGDGALQQQNVIIISLGSAELSPPVMSCLLPVVWLWEISGYKKVT